MGSKWAARGRYSTTLAAPLGPAYLASLLEIAGYRVDVIDGIGEAINNVRLSACGRYKFQGLTEQEIIDRIDPATSILGVSLMFSQTWVPHRALINAIKAARPNLTIALGGEHPTAMPDYVLQDCPAVDYVVTGEGELTFLLLHCHFGGLDPNELPGLCLIDKKDGRFVNNGLGQRIQDFANLPRPAWHLCSAESYFLDKWTSGISYGRNMLILATRGCPYQCTFCSNPTMWTTRYVMRPPADVVDEIEFLISTYGANSVDFADLTAIVKKDWVLEFCGELKRREIDIIWQLPSGTRSEALDGETVAAIYDAGCKLLVYAPESGSKETLRIIKKKLSLDKLAKSVRHALAVGHTIKLNLIIGFPHEKRRHMFDTIQFATRMAILGGARLQHRGLHPVPGLRDIRGASHRRHHPKDYRRVLPEFARAVRLHLGQSVLPLRVEPRDRPVQIPRHEPILFHIVCFPSAPTCTADGRSGAQELPSEQCLRAAFVRLSRPYPAAPAEAEG